MAAAAKQAEASREYAPWLDGDINGITPQAVITDDDHDFGRKRSQRVGYLEGLRGLIALETLLFVFFRLLAPAIATDTDLDGTRPAAFLANAPAWQNNLRKALGPIFWDSTLPAAFFVMLSSRVLVLTFLERRSGPTLAGAVFRRPLRFLVPILGALALPSIVSVAGGFRSAQRLSEMTANSAAVPPTIFPNFLEYFNSIFTLYFDTQPYKTDRGVAYTPLTGLMWVIPVIFSQSFTIYVFAALMPYITLRAKVWGFPGFILVTYWLGSWAWYNLTALQLAEFTLVYLPLVQSRKKLYAPPVLFLVLGLILKWAWASVPSRRNDEYLYHTDKSYGGLNRYFNPNIQPYPRVDDFLVVAGSMALLDLSSTAQRIFDNPVLRYLGRISFMLFLTCGTVCLALGSKLTVTLRDQRGWTNESAVLAVCFFACVPVSILAAEACYWLVEWPSGVGARWLFRWIRI